MATATNSAALPAVRNLFYQRGHTAFFRPVSPAPLATFRVAFGLLMLLGTVRFMALGWVEDHYLAPRFHFKYWGFGWVEPLGAAGMYAAHFLMATAAIGVMLGLFYRLSAAVLFLLFTYTELIDLTYYLNHYYFVSLAAGLLCLLPANRSFSLDILRKPQLRCTQVPAWCVGILKVQVAIVYLFAGLAKVNTDWLIHALPLKYGCRRLITSLLLVRCSGGRHCLGFLAGQACSTTPLLYSGWPAGKPALLPSLQ